MGRVRDAFKFLFDPRESLKLAGNVLGEATDAVGLTSGAGFGGGGGGGQLDTTGLAYTPNEALLEQLQRVQNQGGRFRYLADQAFRTPETDFSAAEQARGQQMDLIGALQQRAAGEAASPAEMQLQRALQQQQALAMSQARSTPGVAPGLALRQGLQTQAQLGQDASAQASILRAQEQARAEQALGSLLGQVRSADIGQAQFQTQTEMQQQQLNRQLRQAYEQMGMNAQQAALQAQMQMDRMRQQGQIAQFGGEQAQQQFAQQQEAANRAALGQLVSTGASIVGGIYGGPAGAAAGGAIGRGMTGQGGAQMGGGQAAPIQGMAAPYVPPPEARMGV